MLKNLPKVLSPDLLKLLSEMGHGDEVCIADANFPSHTFGQRVVRADGISGTDMLNAILTVLPLDTYAENNLFLMETTNNDPTPTIWKEYEQIAKEKDKNLKIGYLSRFDFYDRAKKSYVVVATGESAIYANIIIKKGVIK